MIPDAPNASMQVRTSNRKTYGKKEVKQQESLDSSTDVKETRKTTFHYLFNAGKQALSLPFFDNVCKQKSQQENMEEMHEIFRDGNFVMIDGLIVLAPEDQRCKGE